MKSVISITILASVLLISPAAKAQNCRWTKYDLRGTYAMSGSGWIDLSKLAANLPPGTVPMSWALTPGTAKEEASARWSQTRAAFR